MKKGDDFVMDLENLPKVNQVIYTLDTICDQNILTLAQAVLEVFCSQASIGLHHIVSVESSSLLLHSYLT